MKYGALLIALVLILVLWTNARAKHDQQIRCAEGYCMVPQDQLEAMARQAQKVDTYAEMCGWPQ